MKRDETDLIALQFLITASKHSIENTMLNRMAESQNLRKDIQKLIEDWIDRRAEARLLEWFMEHGDELSAGLNAPEVQPVTSKELRDSLRRLLNSA